MQTMAFGTFQKIKGDEEVCLFGILIVMAIHLMKVYCQILFIPSHLRLSHIKLNFWVVGFSKVSMQE
jgi:hypothetical protein